MANDEGILEQLKQLYFEWEDKWYAFLDDFDRKDIPVYKVIDPIDKVLPSFALALVLLLVIVLAVLWMLLSALFLANTTQLTVRVLDGAGNAVEGADVLIAVGEASQTLTTDEFGEARATLARGAEVEILATAAGFEQAQAKTTLTADQQTETLTLGGGVAGAGNQRTIRLVNAAGQPIFEPLKLTFECRNSQVTPPADITVTTGKAVVAEPAGCGGLIASVVDASRYQNKVSVQILEPNTTIFLEAAAAQTGTAIINLTSTEGDAVDGVEVELYKYSELVANQNIGPIDLTRAAGGQARFEAAPGTYVAKAYDPQGRYAEAQTPAFSVPSGGTVTENLVLQPNIIGQIQIRVVNKVTRAPIADARVMLTFASDDTEFKTLRTNADGLVTFHVSRDVEYHATIDAADYVLRRVVGVRVGNSVLEMEVEPCSALTCGTFNVKVVDEDGSLVSNATVALYNAETGFLAGYQNRVSDVEGIARFPSVKSGNYYAFAFKGSGSGRSEDMHFAGGRAEEGVHVTVTMTIGNATLRVVAQDRDAKPVPFALITVYDARTGGRIGADFADAQGVYEVLTKADKEVYVVTGAEGFADYVTKSVKLQPEVTSELVAVMEPKIIGRPTEIKFLGLYQQGRRAATLAAGQEYVGRWQVRVPEQVQLEEVGAHIRVGTETLMEKDDLYIKEVNAPFASVVKATAFNERSGLDISGYDYTFSDAKWFNAVWTKPKAGIYEIEAVIRVRGTATIGEELPVFYRAWARNGVITRSPPDDFIESYELYNNAFKDIYQVGVNTLCDQDFCFNATITDLREALTEQATDVYLAEIFKEYEISFSISNNAEVNVHDNANLRITNPDRSLLLGEYVVLDAESQPVSGSGAGYELPWIDVGDLTPGRKVQGRFKFTTQRAVSGVLNFRLVSDQQIVFDKAVNVAVAAPNQLAVLFNRTLIPSGIANNLTTVVTDAATREKVQDAIVRCKDELGNIVFNSLTNSDGEAVVRLPAQKPGAKIVCEVEKQQFDLSETEIEVTDEILGFEPASVAVALNVQTKQESEAPFKAKNLTDFPLLIESIELDGDFRNLLDERQMLNWLQSNYKGVEIAPNGSADIVFRAFLSDDGRAITERADVGGDVVLTVSNFGQRWLFKLPFRVSIGFGSDVDDPGCLQLTRSTWETATEGTPVTVEFQLQNNCTIDGQPTPLRNVEARVKWTSNQLGSYTLQAGGANIDLRSAFSKTIVDTLQPGETVNMLLSFTPFGAAEGVSKADVEFSATNPLENANQVLTVKVSTSITIANLKQCVAFDKHYLQMPQGGTDAFTVSTRTCGPTTAFRLESPLKLSLKEFTLGENGSQQVQVLSQDDIPGQYPIFVYSKGASEKQFQLLKNIRAVVDSTGCLALNRYEFDVLDTAASDFDGFDNAQLLNRCSEKEVIVSVDERDFVSSLKKGALWGALGLGFHLLTDKLSKKPAGETDAGSLPQQPPQTLNQKMVSAISKNSQANDAFYIYWTDAEKQDDPTKGSKVSSRAELERTIADKEEKVARIVRERGNTAVYERQSTPTAKVVLGTGLASLAPGNAATGYAVNLGDQLGGAALGQAANKAMSGLFGAFTGQKGPIVTALAWGVAGFLVDYLSAERDREIRTIQDAVDVNALEMLAQETLDPRVKDTETSVRATKGRDGKPDVRVERDPRTNSKVEKMGLTLTNETGFITEPEQPKYKFLDVTALEHMYPEKRYKAKDFDADNLDEDEPEDVSQLFRVEFNAVPPEMELLDIAELQNCQAGIKTGFTGKEALPRVQFDWSWNAIKENSCNLDNPDHVYCDATQFSIAVLQKVHALDEYLATRAPFTCPSELAPLSKAEAVIPAQDIGIKTVNVTRVGDKQRFDVTLQNNNVGEIGVNVKVTALRPRDNFRKECPVINATVGADKTVSCELSGLGDGVYEALAEMDVNQLCANCKNVPASDRLQAAFSIGESGLSACTPYSTARLGEFLAASGVTDDSILSKVKFRATLTQDRFSPDFHNDFDEYSLTKSFFAAPSYYKDADTGLSKYFGDPARFKFTPAFGDAGAEGYLLPGPGTYDATIDIIYDDGTWSLFKADGKPNARIRVELDKVDRPVPDSPFYYMPFDGTLGTDNSRVGYGVNFAGDTIAVNSDAEVLRSVEITGSTSIPNGIVGVRDLTKDFKRLNVDRRGVVLEVLRSSGRQSIDYSPSYATPIILNMNNNQGEAWAYYSLAVAGDAVNVGPTASQWDGVGLNCSSFNDRPVMEEFFQTADRHGINTACAVIGSEFVATTYGFEFCQPFKFGDLYLKSIFYTPQGTSADIQLQAMNDYAQFIQEDASGKMLPLNGVASIPFNSLAGNSITSMENVLELVQKEFVCISGSDARAEFWWNPKKVFEALGDQVNKAEQACIK